MDVHVGFRGKVSVEDAAGLDDLATALRDDDLELDPTTVLVPGVKDGGVTVALAIVGVALTAIDTLLSTLNFWISTRPKYSATITRGDAVYEMSGLDRAELLELSGALRAQGDALPVQVSLTRRD